MRWKVVVGEKMERWPDVHSFCLDPVEESWIEAPDGIVPGYKQTTFATEAEANAVARRLRAYGFVSATEAAS